MGTDSKKPELTQWLPRPFKKGEKNKKGTEDTPNASFPSFGVDATLEDNVKERKSFQETDATQNVASFQNETTIDTGAVKITIRKNRRVAAALAIFLGFLGIHKFYLGYKQAGIIQIVVTIALSLFGSMVSANWPLCVWMMFCTIEGLKYLITTDEEFNQTYIRGQRTFL